MLKRAILYKDELNKKYIEALDNERNKYFYGMYNNFSITVDESDWNSLQFVSVDKNNNIVGYIRGDIDRCVNYISSLAFINFTGQANVTFSKDCLKFFDLVFNTYKFNKIDWCVFVGNPAEKVYDKLIDKYGGRVVGTYKNDVYTYDKQLCDRKLYELMREDYLKNRGEI